jgi:Holliday junction resolvase RusA-like endonuclease
MGVSPMARALTVVVHGVPGPQGSKRHLGGGRLVESSAKVGPWRAVVTAAAVEAVRTSIGWDLGRLDPVEVAVVFTLTRPASHYRTGKRRAELRETAPVDPVGRPDLDKLIRSTLDALTDAGALVDDARVVELRAVKCYPGGHLDALDTPGAVITLRALS